MIQINKMISPMVCLLLLATLPAGAMQWPDTGQDKCYDNSKEIPCPSSGAAFYGQDAQYNGMQHSYTKLGASDAVLGDSVTINNGWIMTKDNVTGLIWEVKTTDGTIHDKSKNFTWCDTNSATNGGYSGTCGNGTDTEDFITALNNASYGGHSDWRLPTIKELSTLVDSSIPYPGPTLDTTFFPNGVSSYYWSSTSLVDNQPGAWSVTFSYGYVPSVYKSNSYYVRADRAGQ